MAVEDNLFPGQTIIERAVIRKINGDEINLLSLNQGNVPFFRFNARESMFEPMLRGTLFVQDKSDLGESINLTGSEIFEISIRTPETPADGNWSSGVDQEQLTQNLRFHVFRVRSLTDEATVEIDQEEGPATMWALDLGPYEMISLNKTDASLYGKEFIGPIADEDGKGIVNFLADRYFNPSSTDFSSAQREMDIEPTVNAVWLKGSNASYPYGKDNPFLDLGRLMNYISEYAVSSENVSAVNYLFWQDFQGWRFRSIDSLIRDQEGASRSYKVSIDKTGKDKLNVFRMNKKIDQLELLNSSAYKSFYINTEPNYDDPYSSYMPTLERLKKERIEYDYFTDYDKWSHIERYPVLPASLELDEKNSNEMHDDVFGWFEVGEYNNQYPTKFDIYKNSNNKSSLKAWQTNFDITDLDYDLLKQIRTEIVLPATISYLKYLRKRLLKEKWNVYKYSICCEEQPVQAVVAGSSERELGYIVGFELLPQNLFGTPSGRNEAKWKYFWTPVEIWETEQILLDWPGIETDPGLTGRGAPIRWKSEGIFVPEGNTLNVDYSELTVVRGLTLGEVPSVFEAWNINELLNNTTTNQGTLPQDQREDTGPDGTREYLYAGNFPDQNDDSLSNSYIGPGLNSKNVDANYGYNASFIRPDDINLPEGQDPENFTNTTNWKIIPIGGMLDFGFTFGNGPDGEFIGNDTDLFYPEGSIEIGRFVCIGQVVEIFKWSRDQLRNAGVSGNQEFIYVFNEQNAIDSSPYNPFTMRLDMLSGGLTGDPYVPPGSEEEDDENEEG